MQREIVMKKWVTLFFWALFVSFVVAMYVFNRTGQLQEWTDGKHQVVGMTLFIWAMVSVIGVVATGYKPDSGL